MGIALGIVSFFAIGEFFVLWALLNRLLIRSGIAPIQLPTQTENVPEVEPRRRKPLFSVPIID